MSMKKYIPLLKRIAVLLAEGMMLSFIGAEIAFITAASIASLQRCSDLLCALGAAAGFSIAFAHQFRFKRKFTVLVFYLAAVYFSIEYCQAFRTLFSLETGSIVLRVIRFSFIVGILILEYKLIIYFIRQLQMKRNA